MSSEGLAEPVWFSAFREETMATLDRRLAAMENRLSGIEDKTAQSSEGKDNTQDWSMAADEYSSMVERRVKALLSRLTMGNFDQVSDQIIAWADKSENETDGRTLLQATYLIYDAAVDDMEHPELYTRLSRKVMERVSSRIHVEGNVDMKGMPRVGSMLFRKYLLNRYQEDFKSCCFDAAPTVQEPGKCDNSREVRSGVEVAAENTRCQGMGVVKFICVTG